MTDAGGVMPDGDPDLIPDIWDEQGRFSSDKAAAVAAETATWPDPQRQAMLATLRAMEARADIQGRYNHPAEIAQAVMPEYVITPALLLIALAIETVLRSPRKINLLITMPPQEGKSLLAAVFSVVRALQRNPDLRVILATYASELAESHSRAARDLIDTHGTGVTDSLTGLPVEDKLGLRLARGANKVSSWSVVGGRGGLVAVGVGGPITGRPADLMIIDDPFKNMMEADSKAHRDKVEAWFSSVVLTRLSPSASIILIQTRWHPEDLAGKVLAGEQLLDTADRTWRRINIPAIAEAGIPDALNREPGTPMVSARDTAEAKRNFSLTHKQVGDRVWYALYQGNPRNPAGGIFQKSWFDSRLPVVPDIRVAAVVGVDPAETGEGDEAGIIAGMLLPDGTVVLTHDRSGHYTSDRWAVLAVQLALEIGAREVAVEGYTTAATYKQVVRRAYTGLHAEAVARMRAGAALNEVQTRALADIPPFQITMWRGPSKADAVARSGLLSQALETGRCRTVEYAMAVLEEQAADWQAGQHQPDRVAAAVIAHDRLAALGGGASMADPTREPPPDEPPAWLRRRI